MKKDKSIAFLEKNVEWFALGIAGVWLLFVVWTFWLKNPAEIALVPNGPQITPGKIDSEIDRTAAEELRSNLKSEAPNAEIIDEASGFKKYMQAPKPQMVATNTFEWLPAITPLISGPIIPVNDPHQLPVVPVPTIVAIIKTAAYVAIPTPGVVGVGGGGGQVPGPAGVLLPAGTTPADKLGVTIFLDFDEGLWAANQLKAGILPGNIKNPPQYLKIELQRRERRDDGSWSAPIVVLPAQIKVPGPGDLIIPEQLPVADKARMDYIALAGNHIEDLIRPPYFTIIWPKTAVWAEPKPAGAPGGAPANPLAQPVAGGPVPKYIWAHDVTAQGDKVYRYRARVIMTNPYYDLVGVRNPNLAKVYSLPDNNNDSWTRWSDLVVMPPKQEFFAIQVTPNGGLVRFSLYNWESGGWKKSDLAAIPGDMVGSGPYMVADIRNDKSSVVLVDKQGNEVTRSIDPRNQHMAELELNPPVPPAAPAAAAAAGAAAGGNPPN